MSRVACRLLFPAGTPPNRSTGTACEVCDATSASRSGSFGEEGPQSLDVFDGDGEPGMVDRADRIDAGDGVSEANAYAAVTIRRERQAAVGQREVGRADRREDVVRTAHLDAG